MENLEKIITTKDELKQYKKEFEEYFSKESKFIYVQDSGLLFKDNKPTLYYKQLPQAWSEQLNVIKIPTQSSYQVVAKILYKK